MARMKIGGLNFYNDVWYNDFVVVVVGRPTTYINNKEKKLNVNSLFSNSWIKNLKISIQQHLSGDSNHENVSIMISVYFFTKSFFVLVHEIEDL